MADNFGTGNSNMKKADGVSDAINKLLQTLSIRSAKPEGIRDYFHVGVIGYGSRVGPAFGGALAGRELVPISEVANSPLTVETRTKKTDDGAGGILEQKIKFPIWFEPISNGGTPMCKAFTLANSTVQNWTSQHRSSYPPIVFNITDGESTDGDPRPLAETLKKLSTDDGETLLLNLHTSSSDKPSVSFPDTEEGLPDQYAQLLFQMSSVMPEAMRMNAQQNGFKVSEKSRGFVFNADLTTVIEWLDIGTRASNMR
jgi:hypothetical protein